MSKNNTSLLLRTPEFRMSYVTLIDPERFKNPNTGQEAGEPKFSLEMLFKPEDLDNFQVKTDDGGWEQINVRNAMAQVAKAKWPELNLKEAVKAKDLSWPLVDGEVKKTKREAKGKNGDVYTGMQVIPCTGSQKYPPQLYIIDGGKYRELNRAKDEDRATIDSVFVPGYYASANVNVKATEFNGKFITFYVNSVLFRREGERIGGMSATDRFGGIDGGQSSYDPTDGLDDEIPF